MHNSIDPFPPAEFVTNQIITCPFCRSKLNRDEGICIFCNQDIQNTRVCPYCKSTIPAQVDPCSVCGRLEPAESIEPVDAAKVKKEFFLRTLDFIAHIYIFQDNCFLDERR